MPDYKTMYYKLYRAQAKAIAVLQDATAECERMYMESAEPLLAVTPLSHDGNEAPPEQER